MKSRVKFFSPENSSGALQLNSVASFSYTTEEDGGSNKRTNKNNWLHTTLQLVQRNPSVQTGSTLTLLTSSYSEDFPTERRHHTS